MREISIIQPDDFHVHFRRGEMLKAVVPDTAKQFGRAIVMPNTCPEIMNVEQAIEYKKEILRAIPAEPDFKPLMTLYLNKGIDEDEVKKIKNEGVIHAVKLYLKGVTTNSNKGVEGKKDIYKVCEHLSKYDIPLLIHGEVTSPEVDIFDREKVFIDTFLSPLIKDFPKMRIVMEHITTKEAVDFLQQTPSNLSATITAHHLYIDRNDLLVGGIKPHYYCLPVVKKNSDREALIKAATSGNPKFFCGTDSAPHLISQKESECGCAGIYSAVNAVELYVQIFDDAKTLQNLEGFLSLNGASFYGLEPNRKKIKLRKTETDIQSKIPDNIKFGDIFIRPFRVEEPIFWEFIT